MRVVLSLGNQNQTQVAEEVVASSESQNLEPQNGVPLGSDSRSPDPPTVHESPEAADSGVTTPDSGVASFLAAIPGTVSSTQNSTAVPPLDTASGGLIPKKEELKSIASEVEGEKIKKRKAFQGEKTGTTALDQKPTAAGIEKRNSKKRPKSDTTKYSETKMVETKPSKAERDQRDYENRYSPNLFGENRAVLENDSEMRVGSGYFDNQENDPAAAMGDCSQADIASSILNMKRFEEALRSEKGLEIIEQEGDGNCLFRAISLQIYGDSSSHAEVRKSCLDFMARDEEHFSQFVTGEPFLDYIAKLRLDGAHGSNPEIQAISELFNRPIEVYVPENGATPLNIFHAEYKTADAPIRLSYHDGNHYNAVVDPLCPTAGLGLGLPGLQPGLADRMQVAKAVKESDLLADEAELERAREESHNDQLQRAIKESTFSVDRMYKEKAMAMSDLEATEIELEQAALVSSLETYQHGELGRKPPHSSGGRRREDGSLPTASASIVNNNDMVSASGTVETATYASSSVAAASPSESASVAAASGVRDQETIPHHLSETPQDEYPQTVQELVMNGFDLSKVIHAYELIGDNFDDLLAFLISSNR